MKARFKVMLAIVCIVNGSSADVMWPLDSEWNPLMQGTNFYWDTVGDVSPASADLVGTPGTYPAGSWALVEDGYFDSGVTDDAFMFRLRIGDNGESRNNVWQISMDTDGDASNVEWILQLAQTGRPSQQGVELIQTAVGGPTLKDIDIGKNDFAWLEEINLFSRWSAIPDSTEYYVDIAIPWTTFTSITGVSELEQIRTVISTSSSRKNVKGDAPLGAGLNAQISDVLSDNIPEPAVASLLLGSGFGFLVFRRIFKRPDTDNDSP